MRVLVTGGTGYIGKRLIRALAKSHDVVCVSKSEAGEKIPGVVYVASDMMFAGWTGSLPGGVDLVIHLAQSRNHRKFPGKADEIFGINVRASFELLEWSRECGVKRFLYASTANVYSALNSVLVETDACDPQSMYGASKLCGEKLLSPFSDYFEVAALRFFTVYGKSQEGRLLPEMVRRLRSGEEILLAQGVGVRLTPVEVGVLVDCLCRMVESERFRSNCYNICGSQVMTLREVVDVLAEHLGVAAKVRNTEGDVVSLCGNSDRWTSEFGNLHERGFREAAKELL